GVHRAEPLVTATGHAHGRGQNNRVDLRRCRHPMIISDGRQVVHAHVPAVAAEAEYPVRHPSGNHCYPTTGTIATLPALQSRMRTDSHAGVRGQEIGWGRFMTILC